MSGESETRKQKRRNEIGAVGKTVAANVRALRVQQGFTQVQLAQAMRDCGQPFWPSTITFIEGEGRRVDVDELAAFAAVFGVEPHLLLEADAHIRLEVRGEEALDGDHA